VDYVTQYPMRPLQHLRNLRTGNHNPLVKDVVLHITQVSESNAHHTARYASTAKRLVIFAKVCRSRPRQHVSPTNGVQRTPHPGQRGFFTSNAGTTHREMDNIKHVTSLDPASSISLCVIAANGSFNTKLFQTLVLTFWLLER